MFCKRLFIFRAVVAAPNPELPIAIANVASVGVFLVVALFARWIPTHFNAFKVGPLSFVDIILTIIGTALSKNFFLRNMWSHTESQEDTSKRIHFLIYFVRLK